jgi:membrane protease YdiL (CAAX protease family)
MADAKDSAGLAAQGGPPTLAAARLVALALGFYGLVFAAACAWRLLADGEWPWRAGTAAPAWSLPARVAVGAAVGGALVLSSRVWTSHSAAGRRLADELGAIVGSLGSAQAVLLAAVSGLGEEAFFRGALQPQVGWPLAAVLFGLAHFHPRRGLRVWSLTALVAGLAFGLLFEATGDLVAPAVAHCFVNAVNLRWLARRNAVRAR